jgi:primosomal protein N' (replication factor Y) (superfamily II helicase)
MGKLTPSMSESAPFLRVALPVPLLRLFDYRPPDATPIRPSDIGRRVQVPFGSRTLTGVVVDVGASEKPLAERVPPEHGLTTSKAPELRAADAWLDPEPIFHGELLASLRWLAHYTHAPLGETLNTALPAALRRGEPLPITHDWAWTLTAAGETARAKLRGLPKRFADLLADIGSAIPSAKADPNVVGKDAIDRKPRIVPEHALDTLPDPTLQNGWRTAARALAKRGLVERIAIPASILAPNPQAGPTLNPEQTEAYAAWRTRAADTDDAPRFAIALLEGVTGSGKTELYLQAIADALARGRQALVLVPEIGLTPQTLSRFRARLGVQVHALHSGLNDKERAYVWTAAARGEARVIVGTRSAVFVPLPEAGLIVIDEEHDGSYKQQDGIRYHARDFALVRAKALNVPVLLGSATPSLETLHNAHTGRYTHLRLRQRAGAAKPPAVRVLDVRKRALDAGLAQEVIGAIRQALDAGGQVLVFKNRRGYAPVLQCHDCGWSAHCRRCSTPERQSPMTVHGGGRRLQCHHCGARQTPPSACPDCASLALQPQGIGTERLEEMLAERFTDVPVLRIDSASTQRKDGLQRQFDRLGERPGILVGTQMLAKGHDLPHLTLVAVVGIDEGLFSADFRASEKLAQLLIQVAGRAGRADKPGVVLLQTHHPEHSLLQTLIQRGYRGFAEDELALREAAGFPPFAHLALLRAEAPHADAPMAFLQAAKTALRPMLNASGEALSLHGPMPAPMPKRAAMYRAQLLLSCPQRRALHTSLDATLPAIYALPDARKVRWSLDMDPQDLY